VCVFIFLNSQSSSSKMLRIHTLENNQAHEAVIYRIKQNCTIRFINGATLLGDKVNLFINYPTDDRTFVREEFQELKWLNVKSDDYSLAFVDIELKLPGTYKYYFTLNDNQKSNGNGNFIVEPKLLVGQNEELGLDSIQCQTVLSKCLGYFDNWKEKLQVAFKSGYNAIHFTPIQELGASKSAYSLKDHKKLNPMFNLENSSKQYDFDNIAKLVEFIRTEWKMVSFTDIVLNHTANETPWLQEHPESTYNLTNSPHLRPAYLLDRLCWHISMDINSGKWQTSNLPKQLNCEDHLNRLREIFKSYYLPLVNIHELYLIGIDEMVTEFEQTLKAYLNGKYSLNPKETGDKLIVIQDEEYRRFKSKVDLDSAIKMASNLRQESNNELWTSQAVNSFRQCLNELNGQIYDEIQSHLNAAVENVISATRYERLDPNGPKIEVVSCLNPLVPPYFTHIETDDISKDKEIIYDTSKNQFAMAHNGWVMGDDPLRNFAERGSNVYLRRELIAWGDSVKLRYGDKIEDSPFLWNYMREYVNNTATIFHGIRLDNCHSTPIHVAKYLLDSARKIRPNLFVMAELFTSSEYLDNLFVNQLGINSLIRESFSCPDSHDLGRLLHRFSGDPVGAFSVGSIDQISNKNSKYNNVKPLVPSMSHAILYDQTHDNESPFKKRTPHDLLPTAALVSMCCSAIGSNRGYDELVPHHIHVVNERRVYTYWNDDNEDISSSSVKTVSPRTGIISARILLNNLHKYLQFNEFNEVFVDQVDFDTVAVTRFNPKEMKSVILVARTVFFQNSYNQKDIRPLTIAGNINNILFEMKMIGSPDKYKEDAFVINGVQDYRAEIRQNLKPEHSEFVSIHKSNGMNQINFTKLEPGNVIAFEIELEKSNINAMKNLEKCVQQFYTQSSDLKEIVSKLSLDDLNFVLFRIASEEYDECKSGPYKVPNFKDFNYCGLSSLMFYWRTIRTHNDLGHPICENLRQGLWLPNYISNRLMNRSTTIDLANWLKDSFHHLENLPHYLIPKCFDKIVTPLYSLLLQQLWNRFNTFVQGNELIQLLSLGSIAYVGFNNSSPLPPLSNQIQSPKPNTISIDNVDFPKCVTISAGLPHFSTGYMRNWGRDTFIAIRGSLLVTGRFDEARYIILGFAGVLRHGLIPNLLDKGLNSRYNCRDAVWWWLQAVKDYCELAPNGIQILNDSVNRIYPTDDSLAVLNNSIHQKLSETMQEALTRHFVGIDFIERNAGKQIDEHMKPEGFNVKVTICKETGFPSGGNGRFNCGTWMDKMGSSDKAGNRGIPATPRDGCDVEIVGLCYSVVNWLSNMNEKKDYQFDGVSNGDEKLSFREWANKIKANFEKHFYVDINDPDPLVNKREIYKDTVGASEKWRDFQLRCNFVVSMAVAPELFNKEHARKALDIYEKVLVSSLGVRTLDPSDWNYNGDYNNSDDSDNFKIAHGFNYHNGPEWLWPLGYYLRARFVFFDQPEDKTVKFILNKLSNHLQELKQTDWYGLPELTNSNGSYCNDSCRIQAWTHGTLLDVLYDLQVPFNKK